MSRAIHVAPNAGVKDPMAKLAKSAAERAQTQISGTETRDQQNPPPMTAHIGKRPVEETVKREGRDLCQQATFTEQTSEAWLRFGSHRTIRRRTILTGLRSEL